jgi:hypothetical protein
MILQGMARLGKAWLGARIGGARRTHCASYGVRSSRPRMSWRSMAGRGEQGHCEAEKGVERLGKHTAHPTGCAAVCMAMQGLAGHGFARPG